MTNSPPIVLLDYEASGLHATSFPTEVAWVAADLSCGFTACIKPADAWTEDDWSLEAQAVHGLDYDRLALCGEPAAAVAAALNNSLRDADILTDSPSKDGQWNRALFNAAEIDCAYPTAPLALVWTISPTLLNIGRAIAKATPLVKARGIYDSDATIIAALNALGGGMALFEGHIAMTEKMVVAAGIVEHRALDDCIAHGLKWGAVEVLGLPPQERDGRRDELVRRAVALREEVWKAEAERLVARTGGVALKRARAACECVAPPADEGVQR